MSKSLGERVGIRIINLEAFAGLRRKRKERSWGYLGKGKGNHRGPSSFGGLRKEAFQWGKYGQRKNTSFVEGKT